MSKANVGTLRQQSALCDADRQIVIVSDDPEIMALRLRVVEVYPDTTNQYGDRDPTFKIKVERSPGRETRDAQVAFSHSRADAIATFQQ